MFEFESLLGKERQTTLAYWLGVLRVWPPKTSAAGVYSAMSYQYEIEEQAGFTGRVFPEDADWNQEFGPVAPVQLAKSWSPVPLAIRVLGEPKWTDTAKDAMKVSTVVVAWPFAEMERTKRAIPTKESLPDERQFLNLLAIAGMRAVEQRRGILLAAKPGWSYDHGGTFDSATQGRMRAAKFAVTNRRPPTTGA